MHEPEDDPVDRELSSPACLMSEASDAYMGYADAAELVALLRQVLESQAACLGASSADPGEQSERIRALKDWLNLLGVGEPTSEGWLRTQADAIERHAEPQSFAARLREASANAIAAALPRIRNQRLHDVLAALLPAGQAAD